MTTTATTAAELYAVSSDFRSLLSLWEAERHCPVPLVDFLLEHGLEGPAECCRWASKQNRVGYWRGHVSAGIYPCFNEWTRMWYWLVNDKQWGAAYDIDVQFLRGPVATNSNEDQVGTVIDALLWLLDRWKIPESAGT